ncbi:hypothetical protein NE865_13657 [Phthorimaea operculella]|nr:hypothetical protein NE865_13657 [Phthorimaea operculella]
MPAAKDYTTKQTYGRSMSTNGMSIQARVYHPATNLMPPSPPLSPTGVAPSFSSSSIKSGSHSWSRQNSQNGGGKYS